MRVNIGLCTFSDFVLVRNSASARDASTPIVLPPKWISSITSGLTSLSIGAMSSLVSSLRPLPSIENIFAFVVMIENSCAEWYKMGGI